MKIKIQGLLRRGLEKQDFGIETRDQFNTGFPHLLKILESPKFLKYFLNGLEHPKSLLKFLMDDQYSFLFLVYSCSVLFVSQYNETRICF